MFSLILLPWPPKVLPSTPQIKHDASSPIHSNIKLGSTLNSSSSSFRHDLVSLAYLFIHWSTMGELMVNPCRHSHHGSTNVLEFSLPFFPDTFSSGLLFWGHTTPLKKNTKQFVRKLFPRNIKNLLWLRILTWSLSLLSRMPPIGRFAFTTIPTFQSVPFFLILLGDCHSPFLQAHL